VESRPGCTLSFSIYTFIDTDCYQIAGGLLAGGALIGAGVAIKKHKDRKEDMQEWVEDAQYRTQQFRQGQASGPVSWILCDGKQIPNNAVPGGKENSGTLYISRGFHKGSISEYLAASLRIACPNRSHSTGQGFLTFEDWRSHWLCSR
jgi:hypothetical protein